MSKLGGVAAALLVVAGCAPRSENVDSVAVGARGQDTVFASTPDSAWVDVPGITLVGFYPVRTNEQLEKDSDLATVLDDFSYHLGAAMDSLNAAGVTVQYRGGDTLWLRTRKARWRVVRDRDSSDVGYVYADSAGNTSILYGVRTYVDLVEDAREFRRTGRVRPRQ